MPSESPLTDPSVETALVFAARLHAGQTRKGTDIPYITHPVSVAHLVYENGGTRDQIIGALLHDTVEDCGGLPVLEDIRETFGEMVADIVDWCTDSCTQEKTSWRERKENHLARLTEAPNVVNLVASSDKLHNASSVLSSYRELGEPLWNRFRGGREGSLWYYRAMTDMLAKKQATNVTARLQSVVAELEALARANPDRP